MMNKTSKIVFGSLLSLVMLSQSYAEDKDAKRPLGCKDLGYQFELKILRLLPLETADKQSLYFIFNSLAKPVNLYQMRQEDSTRSIYMNHVIRPRQWAILSTSEPEVRYICTVNDGQSNYGKVIDCGQSLQVCEYARVKYGMNNRGNFWLEDNSSSTGAVFEVLHYGIIPR